LHFRYTSALLHIHQANNVMHAILSAFATVFAHDGLVLLLVPEDRAQNAGIGAVAAPDTLIAERTLIADLFIPPRPTRREQANMHSMQPMHLFSSRAANFFTIVLYHYSPAAQKKIARQQLT
jgi:hypothetical protein